MRTPPLLWLVLAVLAPAGCVEAPSSPANHAAAALHPPDDGRLPRDVRPLRYRLALTLDPAATVYAGSVEIDLSLDGPRDVLWLNGRKLALRRPVVRRAGADRLVGRVQDGPNGVFAVVLPEPVGPGEVTLRIEFSGAMRPVCEGLFVQRRGGERYVSSQLEATYARDVFPCFDEPANKTPFDVTIRAPSKDRVISNSAELSSKDDGGIRTTVFATTPPLPTYLLAFFVGPFDVVETVAPPSFVRPRPIPLRAITWKGRGADARWALDQAGGILEDEERYLAAEYPFSKLDLVTASCPSAGMENAGAVAIDEQYLLAGPSRSSVDDQRRTVDLIAHELAHSWYGDSLTLRWWDDAWLNEAFASWMAGGVAGRRRPADHVEVQRFQSAREGMASDVLAATRALHHPVKAEREIAPLFGSLLYDKGPAVLRMVEHAAPEGFQRAMQAYVAQHRRGSVAEEDVLLAIHDGAGADAAAELRSFVDQPGVPLVDARLDCSGPRPVVRLHQSRFVRAGGRAVAPASWTIPICVRYGDGAAGGTRCAVLSSSDGELALPSCPKWILPNADGAGYYHWLLPEDQLRALADAASALAPVERLSLVDTLVAAWDRASLPADTILELFGRLAADPDPRVADGAMRPLRESREWLAGDAAALRDLDAYGQRLYGGAFAAAGWDRDPLEPPERTSIRAATRAFLALTVRDPAVRAEAAKRGRARLEGAAGGSDAAALELAVAVAEGGASVFDRAEARLLGAEDASDRTRWVMALGAATDPVLAAQARELTLDDRLRPAEAVKLLVEQASFPGTAEATWAWIGAHRPALAARTKELPRGLAEVGVGLCDRRRADELRQWFAGNRPIDETDYFLVAVEERIESCAARREALLDGVRRFLAKPRP